jgi:hypothetical protein
VIGSYVNTLFGDPVGEEKLPSVAMADDKGDVSEVDPKNVIMPSLEDLPDDACQCTKSRKRSVSKRNCRCSSQALRKIDKAW